MEASQTTLQDDVERLLGDELQASFGNSGRLPLFLTPKPSSDLHRTERALRYFSGRRAGLETLLERYDAVVLRGFGIVETADFEGLIEPWPPHILGYAGGAAPRPIVQGRVMEATRYRSDRSIPLHQEMAYLPHYPRRLAFFSRVVAETGGATPIGDMRRLTMSVPEEIREAVEHRGILHERWYAAESHGYKDTVSVERGWQEAFYTQDRAKVEADCTAAGMACEWRPDGSLLVRYRLDGYVRRPRTHERLWFNQIHIMAPSRRVLGDAYETILERRARAEPITSDVRYGDGSLVPAPHIEMLLDLYEQVTVSFPWETGDVMFLDNFSVAHGRSPFTGRREVQVALFA
jgi:alpha-ketoglutarate-dependent taurine dioxygenase